MIYVKINDILYPASINGRMVDSEWDGRESKFITMDVDYTTINSMFVDNVTWSIVCEENIPLIDEDGNPILNENGEQTYEIQQTEYDNGDFSMRGDIIAHADGTCTVKMGKKTDEEELQETTDMLLLEILGV